MGLLFHESFHLTSSLIVAFIVWKRWKNIYTALLAALIGGVLIDLDHLFDYYLAFGFNFNLDHFFKGYQFLKLGKIYVPFHAYEYVVILLLLSIFLRRRIKIFIIALALGILSHLLIDTLTNNMYFRSYSIIERVRKDFEIKELVSPNHYKEFIKKKKELYP